VALEPPAERLAPTVAPVADLVLEAIGVRKAFGGVRALDGVDFNLRRGEVHGLVGQNGAGKSTLVKILNGVHHADAGEIRLDGKPVDFQSPAAARRTGIAMVYQEFSLVPTLTVAQNIFLAHEPRMIGGLIDDRAAERMTGDLLDGLGVDISPRALVGGLPVGTQQLVEIAKAFAVRPRILILDEPTASLAQGEIARLYDVLARLRTQAVAVVFISHHLNEVMTACDRVTVLRDGGVALVGTVGSLSLDNLIAAMTGGALRERHSGPASVEAMGPPLLEVHGLTLERRLDDVELTVSAGEVVGIAGLLGSGRTSLIRVLMGLEPDARGSIAVRSRPVTFRSPTDAVAAGLAYVPEDRRREGIIAGQSVEANLLLGIWGRLTRHGLVDDALARRTDLSLIERLGVMTSGPDQAIEFLSGGNQQKVVAGRALALEPEVLLLDDPTAGIDVASRRELLDHIRLFADSGRAAILVSSELDELAAVCDRVLILHRGRVERVLSRAAGDVISDDVLLAAIQGPGGTGVPA
jgi:ribose transport system ATP-binding protein